MAVPRVQGTRRVWLPAAAFLAFTAVIFLRLVQVQVIEHDRYARQARDELAGSTQLVAQRGSILDRNGHVLSSSVTTWDIYVSNRAWKDPLRSGPAAEALGRLLRIPPEKLRRTVAAGSGDVIVMRDLDWETGRQLLAAGITGVLGLPNSDRVYPEGDVGASVLGFTGIDNVGLAGVEASYNEVLQGRPGKAIFERDTTGEPIPYGQYVAIAPHPGSDLILTVDRYLQQLTERTLAESLRKHEAKGGAIIVMEPATGEILALATSPAFTYSTLDLSNPKQTELFRNRAVTDLYEPGSVMKIVTAASALDAGVVSPDTTYVDTGIAVVYGIPIENWDQSVYGLQTMTGVLQHSINTGAIFMVQKLGQARFQKYLDAFGFGTPTGIDLSGEAGGIVRRPTDEGFSPVDIATQSFGQAISVTPLQMVTAVAAAINGGNYVRPHIVKARIGADGVRTEARPEIVRRVISPETSATLRQMLRAVVEPEGRIHPGKPRDYSAGGKSGTANVPIPNGYDDTQVASFIGFTPWDAPKVLILVKLDENADGLTGTQAAGPIFAKLAGEVMQYLGEPPDSGRFVGAR